MRFDCWFSDFIVGNLCEYPAKSNNKIVSDGETLGDWEAIFMIKFGYTAVEIEFYKVMLVKHSPNQ